MYLVIDTSTRHGAIGLWRDGTLARVMAWRSPGNHTAELMPAVESALAQEGRVASDLQGIAVATGPGGFSALRAGMSVAKGLAFALEIPLVGVSTLEATAYPYRGAGYPVCAVLEAGRGQVAWARFVEGTAGWVRQTEDRVTPEAELVRSNRRHTLFCGEGLSAYGDGLRAALGPRAHLVEQPTPLDRLQGASAIGVARLERGEADPVAGLEPRYLRPPGITTPRPPRSVRYGAAPRR